MADHRSTISVPEMSGEQRRLMRLLSPQEKLDILTLAATERRKSFSRIRDQVDFNGVSYLVYEMDRLDLAVQAMAEGKQVLVHRECVLCHYDMYDTPVRRYIWDDVCATCGQQISEQREDEQANEQI